MSMMDKSQSLKLSTFANETATRKSLILTLVTTYGVKPNTYSGIVQKELVIDDLFRTI